MSTEFKLDLGGNADVEVWVSDNGEVQLAVFDGYDSGGYGLTADQARRVAAALAAAADEVDGKPTSNADDFGGLPG